jgi:hypothetical protein
MTEEIKTHQSVERTTNGAQSGREDHTVDTSNCVERPRLQFNRYLYENLASNVECQLEYWNRKAGCQSNPTAAQALRLKAEGLGYALRLLDAFEPEFRELVECARHAATDGDGSTITRG